jgi:hypothetical protein
LEGFRWLFLEKEDFEMRSLKVMIGSTAIAFGVLTTGFAQEKQAPAQAPVQKPVQAPAQKAVQAPVQAPVQKIAPVQKHVQAPVQKHVQAPCQKPTQAPVQKGEKVARAGSFYRR